MLGYTLAGRIVVLARLVTLLIRVNVNSDYLNQLVSCSAYPTSFFRPGKLNAGHPGTSQIRGGLKVGKKLYVGNLSFSVTDADLEDLFAPFGEVRSAQVVVDRQTGRSRGFGFVEMEIDAEALAAIEALHDHEHGGRRLTVNEAKPREDRGGGGGGGGGRGGYRGGGGGR